jgi:hypothetical protein
MIIDIIIDNIDIIIDIIAEDVASPPWSSIDRVQKRRSAKRNYFHTKIPYQSWISDDTCSDIIELHNIKRYDRIAQ